MAKRTRADLLVHASSAIERDEEFIYDVAAEYGQIVSNVRHMRWFHTAVANWLIDEVAAYGHLTAIT